MSSSSTSRHDFISLIPFHFHAWLHFVFNILAQLSSFSQKPKKYLRLIFRGPLANFYTKSLDHFLNLLFHILQLPFLVPRPYPLSSSTIPFDSYLSPFAGSSSTTSPVLSFSTSNSRASIFITNNYDHHPLALQLALQFAEVGYHVFIQVSSQTQLSEVIVHWQKLKSELNKRHQRQRSLFPPPFPPHLGTVIPLFYPTHDLDRRNEAISTVRAYATAESIDMLSLVHVIHPQFIQRPSQPSGHVSPSFSPPRSARRLSIGSGRIPEHLGQPSQSPTFSLVSPSNSVFYPSNPIPLTVCAESFLCDAFNDILLGPLSTTQDFLPTLVALRGRVVYVCSSGNGWLPGMARDSLRQLVSALAVELKNFRIPVSLVTAPPSNNLPCREQGKLTGDMRSMLTEETDPFILRVFEHEGKMMEAQKVKEGFDGGVFRMVRSALESRFPKKDYPLSAISLFGELVEAIGTTFDEGELRPFFG